MVRRFNIYEEAFLDFIKQKYNNSTAQTIHVKITEIVDYFYETFRALPLRNVNCLTPGAHEICHFAQELALKYGTYAFTFHAGAGDEPESMDITRLEEKNPYDFFRYNLCFENKSVLKIKEVKFNPPATIIFWKDGTKTVVKCQENEEYDPEKGLAMAIVKKQLGNNGHYYTMLRKWLPDEYRK